MNAIVNFFTLLTVLTRRLGVCANVGLIAGALTGMLLSIFGLVQGAFPANLKEVIYISLMFAAFSWIAVLFVLCILSRFTFSSVALPSLLNCLLTCFLTVYLCYLIGHFTWAWLIGMAVGVLIGSLFCRLKAIFNPSKTQ